MNFHHCDGSFSFPAFCGSDEEKEREKMKRRKTKEEIMDYSRRLEEVFRKHGLIPKKINIEKDSDFIVIFPGSRKTDGNEKDK
ncbi:MAG: hypothetical protein IIZ80_06680 [Erysipelotrichaceae bacterium]|nr:hypothetical protein [Erysipelotrichaceae bacterium]